MAIQVFNKILTQAEQKGILAKNAEEARTWLREKAKMFRSADPSRLIQQGADRNRIQTKAGQMFLFKYDAKLKEDLPYWDMFPLVFPFKRVAGGFYGINMHYLHPMYRAVLMDSLYDVLNNGNADETTKLRITYNILNSSAKFKWFKPCVKHYLNSQVDSKFVYIQPNEWDVALFLPLQRFRGATAAQVYRDSRRQVIGR